MVLIFFWESFQRFGFLFDYPRDTVTFCEIFSLQKQPSSLSIISYFGIILDNLANSRKLEKPLLLYSNTNNDGRIMNECYFRS